MHILFQKNRGEETLPKLFSEINIFLIPKLVRDIKSKKQYYWQKGLISLDAEILKKW